MSFALLNRPRPPGNWNAVISDLRNVRRAGPASLVKTDGTFDLAAIMREAHRAARRYPSLPDRCRRMAVALRVVWGRAKAQRAGAVN